MKKCLRERSHASSPTAQVSMCVSVLMSKHTKQSFGLRRHFKRTPMCTARKAQITGVHVCGQRWPCTLTLDLLKVKHVINTLPAATHMAIHKFALLTPSCSERSRCSRAADARACAAMISCTKLLCGSYVRRGDPPQPCATLPSAVPFTPPQMAAVTAAWADTHTHIYTQSVAQ
jgi:hypothetical protein